MVQNCRDSLTESESLCGTICCINHESIPKHCSRASEHFLQCNLKITRDTNLLGSLNRLINVLDSGDIRGLRPNIARTNTLYKSQWCDDVDEFEHVRHNHPKRHQRLLSSGPRNSSMKLMKLGYRDLWVYPLEYMCCHRQRETYN